MSMCHTATHKIVVSKVTYSQSIVYVHHYPAGNIPQDLAISITQELVHFVGSITCLYTSGPGI